MTEPLKEKINLMGMTQKQLTSYLSFLDEKPYRAKQLMKWLYHDRVTDFEQMSNISKSLKSILKRDAQVKLPEIVSETSSTDGVIKWVIRTSSGNDIEMVFIPESNRGTLCISSQAGCILNCSFCSTGKQGFHSNLTAAEIVGQVWLAIHCLQDKRRPHARVVTNVVLMGMGEPLLNFEAVMAAVNVFMDDLGFGLSKRRVTLSTSGVVPKIYDMIGRTDVSLAVSLHAANDVLRNELVPINRKYPIKVLLEAIHAYMGSLKDKKRVVTIEYTLLSGINDQAQHAEALVSCLKNTPCKINLIPFNPFLGTVYLRPSNNAIRKFQQWLMDAGYNTTVRKTRGEAVSAACGQLVGNINDRTKRQQRYASFIATHTPIKMHM